MKDSPKRVVQINVDFDEIREIAHRGVRRAAIFMGLGLNAASDEDFKDYRLSKITGLDLVSPDATDEHIADFKKEFSYWITGNGLRELLESFNVFLDGLHDGCLLMQVSKVKNLTEKEALATSKKFHYVGLPDKAGDWCCTVKYHDTRQPTHGTRLYRSHLWAADLGRFEVVKEGQRTVGKTISKAEARRAAKRAQLGLPFDIVEHC